MSGSVIQSAAESVQEATEVFYTFREGSPSLVPLGIRGIDYVIGGLHTGGCGILAAATGVGKSSIVLLSAIQNTAHVGIISTEDTPDVLGSRILSHFSGVDSLKIRRKSFFPGDAKKLRAATERISELRNLHIAYEVGSSLPSVLVAARGLIDKGCTMVWLDYIQKVRGPGDDRRNEVARTYTEFQHTCSQYGAAGMAVSQFSRQIGKVPQIYWLKESGDLENEARVILLCHRENNEIVVRLAKSTFGGEGTTVSIIRDENGSIYEK